MRLEGKTVLITGGASGIGKRFAEVAADRGCAVIIADVDGTLAERVASTLGGLGLTCDVGSAHDVEAARDAALERFGAVDIVMSHAGILTRAPVGELSDEDWQLTLNVNVIGMARVIRAFVPHFSLRGSGHFILTTSSLALISGHPLSTRAAYVASKAAVIGLAQSTRVAMEPLGVGVTLFAPDATDTPFGAPPGTTSGNASPLVRQSVDEVVDVLVGGLERDQFLASSTSDHARLLRKQADALLDPLAMAEEYEPLT